MRLASKICAITALVLWVLAVGVLLLISLGPALIPEGYEYVSPFAQDGKGWILTAWIASAVLIAAAMLLCAVWKKKEGLSLIPLLLAAIGSVVGLIVALAMRDALPEKVGIQYISQGLTAWRLIYRHLSLVGAGVLIVVATILNKTASRDERIREENEAYVERYDLSGEPLFKDTAPSTIGLDSYGEELGRQAPIQKRKKGLRRK